MANDTKQKKDYSVISLMATDDPIAVYRKEILGKVDIQVLNSFTEEVEHIILEGDPQNPNCEKCYVELWSEKEHVFFKRANRKNLESGYLVEFNRPRSTEIKKSVNTLTNEEIEELVVAPYLSMKKIVDQMTSEAAVMRTIYAAEKAERPEKTMDYLRSRLSLLQSGELEDAS